MPDTLAALVSTRAALQGDDDSDNEGVPPALGHAAAHVAAVGAALAQLQQPMHALQLPWGGTEAALSMTSCLLAAVDVAQFVAPFKVMMPLMAARRGCRCLPARLPARGRSSRHALRCLRRGTMEGQPARPPALDDRPSRPSMTNQVQT